MTSHDDPRVKSRSPSPHPHPYLDPNTNPNIQNTGASGTNSYNYSAGYLAAPHGLPQSFETSLLNQLEQSSSPNMPISSEENFSNLLNSNQADFDFSLYQNPASPSSTTAPEYDSSLLLDPQLNQQSRPSSQSINPADLVSPISSPQDTTHQHSPGPMSPPSSAGPYYTPQHSRHTSLDPSTAAFLTTGHSNSDWQSMMGSAAFQGHRRAPSEVSDVSSVAPSPYMSQHESFDGVENNPSPLLAPQNDPAYDNLGIESFTLSDQQHPQQLQGFSPAHSPYLSPQLMPQQGPEMIPNIPYVSAPADNNNNAQYPNPPTDTYGNADAFPNLQVPGDIGQASQMAPPSINVEFAPPSRDPTVTVSKSTDIDSLSPPARRIRSVSDPYTRTVPRPRSPSAASSLAPSTPGRSLSPFDPLTFNQSLSNPSSREPSPARSSRRQSTSSIERNYILDLADPQRPGATSNDRGRTQKHPATFQCHLCPKRFTRAYNLRSHLRTHTDERPFVCTVCGKAFARQHDRKRHEGLHSGEKKFVCRGDLSRGGHWGCGRRFARADALGRHFRSEAGRLCIKPLLDEESSERERVLMNHQQHQQTGHLQPIPPPLMVPGMNGPHTGNFVLPAALLAQYPALQTLQWDQIPSGAEEAGDIGGRSSFDASSGGEFGYEDDESGLSSMSGMSGGYPNQGNMYNQGQMF
ncbi:hypothetical protein SI65_01088 [Aspergillus cristatus]|uniref:C2H2 type master regulator of conidiophore development brlA n=1 Tax=Aspergillus cristatus TaxID=573508 RepID=A0A1E3BRC2_ASPCR|nr:hypothetical protein SI65_01088 [Aspergillus cristatus]